MMNKYLFMVITFTLAIVSIACDDRPVDQYPVSSYIEADVTKFNKFLDKSAINDEEWVSNPLLVAIKYIGPPNNRFLSLVREDNYVESSTESVITIVVDGYLDDSVRGAWYQLSLVRTKGVQQYWKIVEAREAVLCARGSVTKEFVMGSCP